MASRCVDGDGVGALTFGRMGTDMFSPDHWLAFTKFIASLSVQAVEVEVENMMGEDGGSDGGVKQLQQRRSENMEMPAELSAV